ncbi:hypothetical protein ACHAXR_009576 [Thalassiosira sp. AJA248-18]
MTMIKMQFRFLPIAIVFCAFLATFSTAWTPPAPIETHILKGRSTKTSDNGSLLMDQSTSISHPNSGTNAAVNTRRELLATLAVLPFLPESASANTPVEKTACDPGDARCRQNGKLGDAPSGKPIPAVTNKITYVVQMIVDIGERREYDAGYLRFGLYGDDCPDSVKQLLLFLTRGISSMSKETLRDSIGLEYAPVTLSDGGSVQNICSGKGVDFGVPSQSKAYARSRGMRNAGPDFVPQSRPTPSLEGEAFPRPHSVAGLISVPAKGIGYGSSSAILGEKSSEDEAYSSAFTITGEEASALDNTQNINLRQRVIGQIIDDESMQFLDRLVNLPVQNKVGKVSSGPPLLKVRVREIDVQKVKDPTGKKKKK